MSERRPADLLVTAAACYRAAWRCRRDPAIARHLLRRGDEAMATYDRPPARRWSHHRRAGGRH